MSNWKCWRRAWSWRSFIVFLVYSVCAFFSPLNVCECDFWIESRERADKKSAPSVEHVREQNTEQKPGKIVRIFYKHIVILIKHIPLISCWHFSLFASIRPFFYGHFSVRVIFRITSSLGDVLFSHSWLRWKELYIFRNPFGRYIARRNDECGSVSFQ